MMTTPKPSQVHPVLTREVSLKLWVYEGRSGPQQGVWLGALKGPLSVYCVNMGSKRCINWKRWKGVQLPLIERGRCLVGRVRSWSARWRRAEVMKRMCGTLRGRENMGPSHIQMVPDREDSCLVVEVMNRRGGCTSGGDSKG